MTQQSKLYTFKNHKIGIPSHDWHTFILFRSSDQIVRRYNAWGISTKVLLDFIKKGCRLVIVRVDGKAKYKINPKKWLEKGIVDTLYEGQEPHAFMPVSKFTKIGE